MAIRLRKRIQVLMGATVPDNTYTVVEVFTGGELFSARKLNADAEVDIAAARDQLAVIPAYRSGYIELSRKQGPNNNTDRVVLIPWSAVNAFAAYPVTGA